MGKIYDGLDETTKALADTIAQTRGIDAELAAVIATCPHDTAVDVVVGAINTARAAGKPDEKLAAAARLKTIDTELGDLETQYNDAVKNNRHGVLIGLKNRIAALGQEKATLNTAHFMEKAAATE